MTGATASGRCQRTGARKGVDLNLPGLLATRHELLCGPQPCPPVRAPATLLSADVQSPPLTLEG